MPSLYHIKPASSATTIRVPADFATIQEAVNNATAGDTIQIAPGIYYEHVEVTKSLTIVGEDLPTTIVDGTANGTVFYLEDSVSNIHITGLTIRNAGNTNTAIVAENVLVKSNYHQIYNNIITTSLYGILLSYSDDNTVFNNTFNDNAFGGINLNTADNTNITGNTITESAYGIKLASSLNNIIMGNTISQTSYAVHITSSSTGNTIKGNNLSGGTVGIYSNSDNTNVDHNTVVEGAYGLYFYNNKDGSIYYNTFINSSYGIRIYMPSSSTSSHIISNNKVLNADWGIELVYANGNTFTGNWLQQNAYGMYMSFSSTNTVYHNNFVNNIMQVSAGAGAGNLWDKNGEGNYWSDYEGTDSNGDGIGDTAYRIVPVGYDNYPLMNTWSEHDISIENVTLSTTEAYPGWVITITVTVKNDGKIIPFMSETFNVTVKYDLNIIETKTVANLAQETNTTLTFSWNTTGVVLGNYTINAEASIVPDELNTDNNFFIDGTIKIKLPGDIDGDGDVDYDDFIIFSSAYGSSSGEPTFDERADFDGDENIDYDDFLIFAANYGS